MARLFDHFISPLYMMIFEQDPPCMSEVTMEVLLNIADWYTSPDGTFIRMQNTEKDLHLFSKFSIDKLVMQEVSYHFLKRLSARLHRKKKAPWLMIPFRIGLYAI